MPAYKGNKGNLLQHWVLCELVSVARRHVSRLQFIDAHAMAPMADRRTATDKKDKGRVFDSVRDHLPGQPERDSSYERAWRELVPRGEAAYPNSASFVNRLWTGSVYMLLCERDKETVQEFRDWAGSRPDVEVASGDWQSRFGEGLPESGELTLVSFDPYMFSRRCEPKRPKIGNMYPEDLDLVVQAMREMQKGVMLQLSTYSTNDSNSQTDVEQCIRDRLHGGGFEQVATVRAGGDMMSVVFARGVAWGSDVVEQTISELAEHRMASFIYFNLSSG